MSDAQIAWQPGATCRHISPPGHAIRPRHPARSRAGSVRCPGHSMRGHGHSKTAAARSLAAGRAATQRRCTPAPAAYLPRARARCARAHGICPGGSPAPALGGAGHESGGPAQGRAALHGSCPGGRCPGASPRRRAGPRQGWPKAGRAQGRRRRCPQRLRCEVPTPVRHYLLNLALPPACARAGAQRRARARTRAREGRLRFPGHGREGLQGRRVSRPQRPARSTRPGSCGAAFTEPGTQRGHKYWWFRGSRSVAVCFCCKACVCHFCPVRYLVRVCELRASY